MISSAATASATSSLLILVASVAVDGLRTLERVLCHGSRCEYSSRNSQVEAARQRMQTTKAASWEVGRFRICFYLWGI